MLAEVLEMEESNRLSWQETLKSEAEKLAELLTTDSVNFKQAEHEAVDIGAKAWQIGGLSCMRQLRDTAIGIYRERNQNNAVVDYISFWWNGIGRWRSPSLQETINL